MVAIQPFCNPSPPTFISKFVREDSTGRQDLEFLIFLPSLLQGDMWPKEQTPSLVTAQLLGCFIYLPSKLRHSFPFSGPAEGWKLCFMKLMVGKFKFSYSSSAGGGFSCHEGHSNKHSESAREFQKCIFTVVPHLPVMY